MTRSLNILIAHQSPLYRRGVELALDAQRIDYRSTHCDTYRDLFARWSPAADFDVLLLDDSLPGLSCLCKLIDLVQQHGAAVLLCSTVTDPGLITKFRRSGVRGLLPARMSAADLGAALLELHQGSDWIELTRPRSPAGLSPPSLKGLTTTELKVLNSLGEGLANKQIADSLNLSVHTVKTHMSNIFRKLDISNRTRLAMSVQQLRLSA
ncbi:response regulator transcription factor [Marinobacterium rhizophilum]|uniref:response regulator transcription factor n=1 Tax=Marinobacterium rhizophilum TaxID=420402 RepID=UPI00036E80E4|nr:response regulator transcription factor [Marinobacterium rhizophilum]